MLDRDVTYDHLDGFGPVIYHASTGIDPSEFTADTSYGVANAQGPSFFSIPGLGITEAMVNAGELDDAEWVCFVVPYDDPVSGSAAIQDAGDVGEVSIKDQLVWIPELLSYSMRLHQPIGSVFQRPCRAIAGSHRAQPLGCGWDVSGLWTDFTITAVGAENTRTFDIAEEDATGFGWFPARLILETGENAGTRVYAIESVEVLGGGGTRITLAETTGFALEVSDMGRIRPDCPKTPEACQDRDNYINFNGEGGSGGMGIPVGDATAVTVPGAQMPGRSGSGAITEAE
jgi:uncharacterized phage protein (TIGR02218 family)